MKRTENEFYAMQEYLKKIVEENKSPTQVVLYSCKMISRFEGIVDIQGNLLTPSHWFTLNEQQIEFCNIVKSICNLHISYLQKRDMLKIYLNSF